MANVVIRADDPAAVCTKKGWERWRSSRKPTRGDVAAAVPNPRFWCASTRPETDLAVARTLFLECERWHDARKVAGLLLRATVVDIAELMPESMKKKPGRIQVRWAGSGASGTLRLQARTVDARGRAGDWKDLA